MYLTSKYTQPPCLQSPQEWLFFNSKTHNKNSLFQERVCMLGCSVMSDSLQPYGPQPARLLCPWDSPGKSSGVGCHLLLPGVSPAQGVNPHLQRLLPWQADSLPLHHLGSPRYLCKAEFHLTDCETQVQTLSHLSKGAQLVKRQAGL